MEVPPVGRVNSSDGASASASRRAGGDSSPLADSRLSNRSEDRSRPWWKRLLKSRRSLEVRNYTRKKARVTIEEGPIEHIDSIAALKIKDFYSRRGGRGGAGIRRAAIAPWTNTQTLRARRGGVRPPAHCRIVFFLQRFFGVPNIERA